MKGLNKQDIIGYVGQDPKVKNMPGGQMKAWFSVAVTRHWKGKNDGEWQEKTEWFQVEAWKYLAERVERDFRKGSPVYVTGSTETQTWKDEKTGEQRSQKVVKAADLFLLGDRPRTDSDQNRQESVDDDQAF